MTEEEHWCFENLQSACVDVEFIRKTHMIEWPPDQRFKDDYETWSKSSRGNKACEEGRTHRYAFEMFLQSQRLLTHSYAAARLGMQVESFDCLISRLGELGLSKKYEVYPGISDESLSEDLVRTLPSLKFRTFGNHDSFCELLHADLDKTLKLNIRALFCATADELGEQRTYASTWDNITLKPLSVRHSVWLNFKKPISLGPDRCSKLFFVRHYDELRQYLTGREEPRDLEYYTDFARRSA